MKNLILLLVTLLFIAGCTSNKTEFKISNNGVEAQVLQLKNHQISYTVKKDGHVIIDTSLIGIVVNEKSLGSNSKIRLSERFSEEFDYSMFGGKNTAYHKTNISKFEIKEKDGFTWFLEFLVSAEGVAYRYIVPGTGTQDVKGELSSFRFPNNTKVWYFERNNDWKLKSHAGEWLCSDISQMPAISKMGPVQGLTLTCEMPAGGYALVAEAALYNYSGMRLEAIGDNTFKANFAEGEKGFEIEGDILTPWRCILLADDLNSLVNNTLVPSLNPKPDGRLFADMSWIKPGKAAWYWWSGKFSTFEAEKRTVDNAEKLGFEYTMVDEGWERWSNKWETITELCNYAKNKNVGIFLWKHSNQLNFPENGYALMAGFLDSLKQTGAVGVKVDFMNGETKSLIDFDEALLKLAAERKLMVNFHGCQQSSGEYRTYPNEVSREGIRGVELNNMKEGPLSASHNAALPFTRYVTGHADYTPLAFTAPGETTWAHQLATLVCYYSPFQCIAENPEYLLKTQKIQPAINFINEVPSVWDETFVLPQSKIGELAILARRKGNDWYLGVLSAGEKKQLQVNCNFLKEGNYSAEIFSDDILAEPVPLEGLNPRANLTKRNTAIPFKKEVIICDKNNNLMLNIAANGGAVIWFKAREK
ncbi:alpha-glucosidase [Maribellus comscasis]|uniref:Alpha-glucosidase n=1 Tax=Maribellus comscasis TaxID=2681766 RepID=A0A6I6K523_9BACT|nr:glycoside hydrolase family 97 protein [Maribellus comscasis]QGY47512.1 alpha-glucosidase [Maribellus comscasis]